MSSATLGVGMDIDPSHADVSEPPLDQHRAFLWGLCYRMTGSASDADDLVQETFVRALERPPRDTTAPWRPWLVRVAMNLARDSLRRRRRRQYVGPWLPEPVEGVESDSVSTDQRDPEARYGALESASFAFLIALEALTPAQRAVLLLRDVFDFSGKETATIVDMSEANVRTTHHRARRLMRNYDEGRNRRFHPAERERTESMLQRMMTCIATGNLDGARDLLAADVRAISDGGGMAAAARHPVSGADRVLKLYSNLAARSSSEARVEVRLVNGEPAIVGDDPKPRKPAAPRFVLRIELDAAGRVREIHSVINPHKLGHVSFSHPA